ANASSIPVSTSNKIGFIWFLLSRCFYVKWRPSGKFILYGKREFRGNPHLNHLLQRWLYSYPRSRMIGRTVHTPMPGWHRSVGREGRRDGPPMNYNRSCEYTTKVRDTPILPC